MEKLFEALRQKHPGCEVVDVHFTVNQDEVAGQDVDELDAELAVAVENAEEVPYPFLAFGGMAEGVSGAV